MTDLQEAKDAADTVIREIDAALSSLRSAKSWGTFDIFGGGAVSSWVKRSKIKNANAQIQRLSRSLQKLKKELSDLDMYLPVTVSDTMSDSMLDIWFDNIFTDLSVQRKITQACHDLENLRESIVRLRRNLDEQVF